MSATDVNALKEIADPKSDKKKKLNSVEQMFVKHMEDKMGWNDGRLIKMERHDFFTYMCLPGSSVIRELKKAAKEFGVDIKVDMNSNTWYDIAVKGASR